MIALAVAVPLAYQIFRMGYFAGLVPNPALAKEAGLVYWSQGWAYARDLGGTYLLALPLVPLLSWWGWLVRRVWPSRDVRVAAVLLAPVGAAVLHAVYVIRVGGDFMHGRMLLPSLFGVLLPVTLVRLPIGGRTGPSRTCLAVALPATVWAVACLLFLRVPYPGLAGPGGIADERGFTARVTGQRHPTNIDDFGAWVFATDGYALRDLERGHPRALLIDRTSFCPNVSVWRAADCEEVLPQEQWYSLAPAIDPAITYAAIRKNIGVTGYLVGPRVYLIDRHGLSDPIAARLQLTVRRRVGHEKALPNAWAIARFADESVPTADPAVVAARAALGCGDLAALGDAVVGPLTARRFVRNITLAWQLYRLRIPEDPRQAQDEFCR